MRDQLIIRLTEQAPEQVSWVRLSDSNPNPAIEHGPLSDAANVMAGALVVVLVPGHDVLFSVASVPTQNKQRLLKAIPYALEEELASDVEQLHFAVSDVNTEGQVSVAVVERSLMDAWQQLLRDAGISADILLSELMAVPVEDSQWTLLLDGNNAMLRSANYDGFVAEVENLGIILPQLLKQAAEQLPEIVQVWHDEVNSGVTPMLPEDMEVIHEQVSSGLMSLVSQRKIEFDQGLNLLQGDYSRREQIGRIWRPWRYAASLAAVIFVMQVAIAITESSQLESEYGAIKSESKNIFLETFPNRKRVVNPKKEMKQELDKLKGKGSVKKVNFLSLLADSGTAFKQTSGLVLRSVRYKNGALDVELEVPSLQVLDQLKQKLVKAKKLKVEIQSAQSRKNIVQGRLQIRGAAS